MQDLKTQIFDTDDVTGAAVFGPRLWNALKGRVAGLTDAAVNDRSVIKPRGTAGRYRGAFDAFFRPNRAAAAELLGASFTDWVEENVFDNPLTNVIKSGTHAVSNVLAEIPVTSGWIKAGRSTNDFMQDVWDLISGKAEAEAKQTAKKAAIGTGTVLLIGGGVAVWYFGFYRKKRRGRR